MCGSGARGSERSGAMPEPIVPAVSSSAAGPLGIKHLPRLWLKISLFAAGRLPEGYRHGVGGFDEFVTTTLGIDRDAFVAFIENEKPHYLALEDWVRAHATALTPDAVAKINDRVEHAEMGEEMLADRHARLGPASQGMKRAARINDLDDWLAIHEGLARS